MRIQQGRIVYDSARMDAHTGLRSGLSVDRTLLFGAPGLTVDLVIHAGAQRCRFVHGQVVSDADERPIEGVGVAFADQAERVTTDEHGEFALALEDTRRAHTLRVHQADAVTAFVIPPRDDGEED